MMAWLVPGMVTTAVHVTVLLVMVSLAPALLALLLLSLPALVLAGTRAQRPEQLKMRRRDEVSGLVRGWRRQQLPRLQAAVAAAEA